MRAVSDKGRRHSAGFSLPLGFVCDSSASQHEGRVPAPAPPLAMVALALLFHFEAASGPLADKTWLLALVGVRHLFSLPKLKQQGRLTLKAANKLQGE